MSISSNYSVGAVTPGEAALEIYPKFAPDSAKHGVMFVHGAGSDATYCVSPLGEQADLTRLIATDGYTCFSGDSGDVATWGNPTVLARMSAARTYLQDRPQVKPGKIALVSASMGGLAALNWAAANPSLVSCVVSVIPVIDLNDVAVNNRGGYGASVDAAYPGGWSQGTYGAAHNPLTLAAALKYAGIPILLFYGLTDTLCLPAKTEQFASLAGPAVELVPLPSGHDFTSYSLVDHPRIVEFLNAHA